MQRWLTPDLLLQAYAAGVFPMAESADSPDLHWIDPLRRGVVPLDGFHISRSLARRIRRAPYQVSVNRDFAATVAACADRPETWINAALVSLYANLHRLGHAHSVELWDGGDLVGGVFGIAIGGAFFGESMFSRRTDASKMALAYLVSRLRVGGFGLFDVQFITPHLARLGAQEISRAAYRARLQTALRFDADFHRQGCPPSPASVILQCRSQMS
jgi:leucyl/phenylalanyl-tRNA--protein transferase